MKGKAATKARKKARLKREEKDRLRGEVNIEARKAHLQAVYLDSVKDNIVYRYHERA